MNEDHSTKLPLTQEQLYEVVTRCLEWEREQKSRAILGKVARDVSESEGATNAALRALHESLGTVQSFCEKCGASIHHADGNCTFDPKHAVQAQPQGRDICTEAGCYVSDPHGEVVHLCGAMLYKERQAQPQDTLYRKLVCYKCAAGKNGDPIRCSVCQGHQYTYEPVLISQAEGIHLDSMTKLPGDDVRIKIRSIISGIYDKPRNVTEYGPRSMVEAVDEILAILHAEQSVSQLCECDHERSLHDLKDGCTGMLDAERECLCTDFEPPVQAQPQDDCPDCGHPKEVHNDGCAASWQCKPNTPDGPEEYDGCNCNRSFQAKGPAPTLEILRCPNCSNPVEFSFPKRKVEATNEMANRFARSYFAGAGTQSVGGVVLKDLKVALEAAING